MTDSSECQGELLPTSDNNPYQGLLMAIKAGSGSGESLSLPEGVIELGSRDSNGVDWATESHVLDSGERLVVVRRVFDITAASKATNYEVIETGKEPGQALALRPAEAVTKDTSQLPTVGTDDDQIIVKINPFAPARSLMGKYDAASRCPSYELVRGAYPVTDGSGMSISGYANWYLPSYLYGSGAELLVKHIEREFREDKELSDLIRVLCVALGLQPPDDKSFTLDDPQVAIAYAEGFFSKDATAPQKAWADLRPTQ